MPINESYSHFYLKHLYFVRRMSSARFPAAGFVRPYNADFKMEAERINQINNLCDDLAHRLAELRGYL